jgi:hypothetical protein
LLGTGVAEGDVEAPERVNRRLECGPHVLRLGQVTPDGDHIGAPVSEGQRRGAADAARRAGDERDPARVDLAVADQVQQLGEEPGRASQHRGWCSPRSGAGRIDGGATPT